MSDSIWKKEISFKRKPKAQAEPVAAAEETPAEPKQSLWKKEISFKRKPKAEAAPVETAEPKQSVWKKEISLGRKKQVEQLVQEAAQTFEPAEQPLPAEPATDIAQRILAAAPPPLEREPEPEPEPVPELPLETPTVSTLSPEIFAASTDAPATEPEFAAWPEPALTPEPVEPWLAEPQLPPAPPAPEPVVVHPPVPEAELPPVEPPVAKTPWWKKEIGGSRKPNEPQAPPAAEPVAKTPWWKKEIGGSRKPKQPHAPKERSTPFWKKELSFSRKPTPVGEETEQLPVAKPAPFWKRELSMSKPSRPSLPSLGGRRAKRIVGLKIGASQLAAARVSNNGVAELLQVAREPLATGVVVAGELRDPEALGDALKAFFTRHKLPRKGVRLGIASNRIGVRIFDIVGVDEDKQLANAIQFRAQEALPIPLDEAVLDYRVLDESTDDEGQNVKRVLLVVAYRELVDRYISACRKAGITLSGIDLEAFALLRALGAPSDRGNSALVAVAIGHDRSTFAVSDGRVCEFTRVVDWGGWALNVALARVFDSTPSEVEPLKRQLSLDGTTTPEGFSEDQVAHALDAVRKQIQAFARELVSSLQFYQNQPGSLGIGEIVLTGGTAQLPGLADELERLIGVRVRIGDPLARLKVAKRASSPEQVGSLAVAIGLGIDD